MGLAKDSGGGSRVPTLSPPASCGATVSRRAEEGQGLASQTWLRHTHTPHRLEEPLAPLTQTVSPPVRLSTTASALNGGRFMQKLELTALSRERAGRPEATRSPAPPLLPCRVPGPPPPTPAITGGCPPATPHPGCAPLAMGRGAGPLPRLTCVPAEAGKCPRAYTGLCRLCEPWGPGWAGGRGPGRGKGAPPRPSWEHGGGRCSDCLPDAWRATVLDVCSDTETVGGRQGS